MSMNFAYAGHLAAELEFVGFPPGFIDPGHIETGHPHLRTYRGKKAEIIVNEETSEVRISRLAEDATEDIGMPWDYSEVFPSDIIGPLAIVYLSLLTEHAQPGRPTDDVNAEIHPIMQRYRAAFMGAA
ncbi:hypothetical protein [Nonomuraea basaltis]|uniref:hypothetical protein n=1 Tax=Nonomuraea basaltis TaxID=2495887 RepID=UPI00110C57B8|nr:hypothetical protein [Nonomuraea basaltis]TMR88145.1 hypothetical protein EJK15_67855 [Nonomuraea basaltis]